MSRAKPQAVPSRPAPADAIKHFNLDPSVVFLNHGSFGACPGVILDAQRAVQDELEREPVRFFVERLDELLATSREALAPRLNVNANDLACVTNATEGVNAVMRSIDWREGDEILANDQEYPSCMRLLERLEHEHAVRTIAPTLSWPIRSPDEVVAALLAKVTPRTRICLLSHVTSPTGAVLPAATIVHELRARGIETVLDGAHAPGLVPLDLERIGAAWYVGNLHKWLCGPKGGAFVHVRPDMRTTTRPPFVSLAETGSRLETDPFRLEWDFQGTRDLSASCVVPQMLAFLDALCPGGLGELMIRQRDLALRFAEILRNRLGTEPMLPESMVGAMACVALPHDPDPDRAAHSRTVPYHHPLQARLVEKWGIQVPVIAYPDESSLLVRVSAAPYNSVAQCEYLAEALATELGL